MPIASTLPILLAVVFIATGTTKILGLDFQRKEFKHWNLPVWMRYATGLAEIITGILLCFASTMYAGAILGSFLMLGATVMLWVADENRRSILPLVVLGLFGYLIWQPPPRYPRDLDGFRFNRGTSTAVYDALVPDPHAHESARRHGTNHGNLYPYPSF